jgi:hypothetical protein
VRRPRRSAPPAPVALAAEAPAITLEAGGDEVGPLARLQRSRVAFAVAVTLAALPVLVLDNMSATAETSTDDARIEVATSAEDTTAWDPSSTVTTGAPTTTSTTLAPTATLAPSTSEAPASSEAVSVQAVRAPAPAAPPTTVAPPPPPTTAPLAYGDPSDPVSWERMAQCESGGNWSMNTGNGYYGGLQFSLATWRNVGGSGYPHQASKAEQIKRGQILQAQAGWGQWPHCARELGYL